MTVSIDVYLDPDDLVHDHSTKPIEEGRRQYCSLSILDEAILNLRRHNNYRYSAPMLWCTGFTPLYKPFWAFTFWDKIENKAREAAAKMLNCMKDVKDDKFLFLGKDPSGRALIGRLDDSGVITAINALPENDATRYVMSAIEELKNNDKLSGPVIYDFPDDDILAKLSDSAFVGWMKRITEVAGGFACLMPLLPYYERNDGIRVPKIIFNNSPPSVFHAWVIFTMIAFSGSVIGLKLVGRKPKLAKFCGFAAVVTMVLAISFLTVSSITWALKSFQSNSYSLGFA